MTLNVFVSVIMPVYNGVAYLNETIESILNQTYENFEFVIVDDCSTDDSYQLLKSWADKDNRIKLFKSPSNFGNPGGSGAFAMTHISNDSKYILPIDQDDIAVTHRLEKSILFMEENKNVDICGGWQKMFGTKDRIVKKPEKNNEIKAQMLTTCPISHSTTIFRKKFFDISSLNYQDGTAHDYMLWSQAMIEGNATFHNLQEILLHYRMHENQVSHQNTKWDNLIKAVRSYQLKELGFTSKEELDFHNYWKDRKMKLSSKEIRKLKAHFKQIIKLNETDKIYPPNELKEHLTAQYRKTLLKSKKFLSALLFSCSLK